MALEGLGAAASGSKMTKWPSTLGSALTGCSGIAPTRREPHGRLQVFANDLLTFRGDPAVAAGWLQRARRGLEDRPGSPIIAWLDIVEVGSPATARWSRLPMS